MTFDEAISICKEIYYKSWILTINKNPFYLQWSFEDYVEGIQYCRKWLLTEDMSRSEIVSTAFKAVMSAEEHEARENFRYRGKRVFGPHFDVDSLVEIATYKRNLDIKKVEPPERKVTQDTVDLLKKNGASDSLIKFAQKRVV